MTVAKPRALARSLRSGFDAQLGQLRRRRFERRRAGPKLIKAFADAIPHAFFVEVGANDGEQHDHLRPFILSREWRGIMVEPVPYVFERLRHNYAAVDGVILENAVVGVHDGTLPFYHLVDATDDERRRLPDWYDGIGSLSKEAVLRHAVHIPDIADRLICRAVPSLTFESLCTKHAVEKVDLLVIDTEGYDWELIRHIDFSTHRPQVLVYEHYHLTPQDRLVCSTYLTELGFRIIEEGFDTFCLDVHADSRLQTAWSRARPAVPGVSVHEDDS